ncbi:hypothetical protein RDV64_09975 [Acuticoccus sp. MNP-M23]|nr:hypothetical protein [Acuticoccus sp. MNP-M23]WMS44682.1 hypothetical protein RDV64_09975 [Acuticoccus sp. MNP-M23]
MMDMGGVLPHPASASKAKARSGYFRRFCMRLMMRPDHENALANDG